MPEAVSIGEKPRGQDFTFKFRKGEWAEALLLKTIKRHDDLVPIQYGVSRDDTLYTESGLDEVKEDNVTELKRPDILVFKEADLMDTPAIDYDRLLQYNDEDPDARAEILPEIESEVVINTAVMAVEVEASVFNISERPDAYSSLSTYVKTEDYPRLANWRMKFDDVPLYVCQLFFDRGFIVPFTGIETHADEYRETGSVMAPGFVQDEIPGIGKEGYCISLDRYPGAIEFGEIVESPRVVKQFDGDRHDIEYTWTAGGRLTTVDDSITDPHFHEGAFADSAVEALSNYAIDS